MSTKDKLDDSPGNESFASRWSRRKKAGTAEQEVETPIRPEASEAPTLPLNTVLPAAKTGRMSTGVEADRIKAERAESTDREAETALTDEDMPDVESLGEGSDFTGFMSPGVSDKLRKLALRKLFAGAGFNIRDGLDDYDEDFTNFEPLGDIVTCDMKHRAELEEEKRQKALVEAEAAEKEAADKALAENADVIDEDREDSQDALDSDPPQSTDETQALENHQQDQTDTADATEVADEKSQKPSTPS